MAFKKQDAALAKWDEELARQAELAAGMEESTSTGQFFNLKGGILTWNDSPLPGNQMAVVVLDAVLENVYYQGKYDADNPQGPTCFAFGRNDKEMKPHEVAVEAGTAEEGPCNTCEKNEWGSADTGKGKACKNTRRLALIPAGNLDDRGKFEAIDDPEHFESAAIGFLKLPVTSVKGYAGLVKQVKGTLGLPPHGIMTKVRVVPDPSSQFKVTFEPLCKVPSKLIPIIMKRHEEAKSVIEQPYQPFEERAPARPAARGKAKPQQKRKY